MNGKDPGVAPANPLSSQHPNLRNADPEIWRALQAEERRQTDGIELIASENHVSRAVMETMGSVLTNKYAEGLPGRRYYGGCEFVDGVEETARSRACELFGADHANVQPHSGASANFAAYLSCLKPGDRILGMNLSHGGHLTHGARVNFSGQFFEVASYGVRDDDALIDHDSVRDAALASRPRMIVCGASAYPRVIDYSAFAEIAREVDAVLLVDMAHVAGLVAGGAHPSPVPHADIVASTTHKTLRGPRGGFILCTQERAKSVDKTVFPYAQGGPLMHVIAAKAVAFGEALAPAFGRYAHEVVENARTLAGSLAEAGFHPVSGGTDTHLLLVDLRPSHPDLTGSRAERVLEAAGITANKNTVPNETRSPFVASGLRIGTAAATTRGMNGTEMRQIAAWITEALAGPEDESVTRRIRGEVHELCKNFPVHAPEIVVAS